MRFSSLLLASLLVAGCADSPSTPAAGTTTDAPGSSGAPSESSSSSTSAGGESVSSGDAVEENRAALLALSFYFSGVDISRYLGVQVPPRKSVSRRMR